MAKTFLTPDELMLGNNWLKYVFFAIVDDKPNKTGCINTWDSDRIRAAVHACNALYKDIVNGVWDTDGHTNAYITDLAQVSYYKGPVDNVNGSHTADKYKLAKADICAILANMCQKLEILWDDTIHSPQELEYFTKTDFGKALWNFGCFVTQEPPTRKIALNKSSATGAANTNQKGTASNAGHTLYVSNAGGLTTGQKVVFNNQKYMYWICGEWVKGPASTKPRIHVSPQGHSAPLKVKFTSGQGYNDCILFFDDFNQADAFKDACARIMPTSTVSKLMIKKVQTDTNGYFEVETNCGKAFIKASKLHEDLEADGVDYRTKEECYQEVAEAWNALQAFMR